MKRAALHCVIRAGHPLSPFWGHSYGIRHTHEASPPIRMCGNSSRHRELKPDVAEMPSARSPTQRLNRRARWSCVIVTLIKH